MDQGGSPGVKPETLVLFSDGTGKSSAKLFKTNVWRMYEAVDLGPSRKGDPVQVAYYDNGVGTQAIRLIAMLAGIFGIGLKANVLRLYRFACRNGSADCKIFCFGFSRGAFTIRLVAAMLANYGIVEYSSEAELRARTLDVFRRFMRDNNPNIFRSVGVLGRNVRDAWVGAKRAMFGPHLPPLRITAAKVQFVGVSDTVAAYGGPISEITRGIDDYLWPLTMTDTCLCQNVEIARHALSLDDERDSFQPVLWDEVDWARKAQEQFPDDPEKQHAFRERVKQVWFAGMHSDVGGGYPDESLSYVSLSWMMEEAQAAGLRLLPTFKARARALSNSLGPIHDSRGGLASYYRPQPRKIAAFLHPASGDDLEDQTLSLRDPVLGELPKPPHGLLMSCRVHESVIARLVGGTDDYAPITLPPKIEVKPYSKGLQRIGGHPVVDPAARARLTQRDRPWYDLQERNWDLVLWRRFTYFATIVATALLVAMPLWAEAWPFPRTQANRAIMQRLTSWSQYAPIDWLQPWIHAFEVNWLAFLGLLLAALLLRWAGSVMQGRARTRSYRLWQERIAGQTFPMLPPGPVTKFRNSLAYQRGLRFIKWRFFPAVAAAALVLTTLWLGLALLTQVFWAFKEPGLCRSESLAAGGPTPSARLLSTRDGCLYLGTVERGHRYHVKLVVASPWRDASVPADPIGVRRALWKDRPEEDPGWAPRAVQWLGAPFRRMLDGRYLQPVVKIVPPEHQKGLLPRTFIQLLEPVTTDGATYSDVFDAPADGDLFVFVNDAAFLADHRSFYGNNHGTARVVVTNMDGGR